MYNSKKPGLLNTTLIALLFLYALPLTCLAQQSTSPAKKLSALADSLSKAGDLKGAVKAYQKSTAIDDKNAVTWFSLGGLYQKMQQYDDAVTAYNKSAALKSPSLPLVFIKANLAKTYSLKKDSVKALDLLTVMTGNGYLNYPELTSAGEYEYIRQSPRFAAIVAKAKNNAYPCINNPHNRELDFWVGEWNVYQTGTDYQVGKEKVEKAVGDCTIIENWTDVNLPNDGKSLNFVNPQTNKWEQVWIGSGGVHAKYYNGEYKDNAMRFESDGVDKAGNKLLFHLTFFNQNPKQLRQLFEQSADGGKTWVTSYDFTYKRIN